MILDYPSEQLQAVASRLMLGEFKWSMVLAQCFAQNAVLHAATHNGSMLCGVKAGGDDALWTETPTQEIEVWCEPCLRVLLMINGEDARPQSE